MIINLEDLPDEIIEIGDPITPADIDTYGRLREIQDRSFRLRTVINAWERQQKEVALFV